MLDMTAIEKCPRVLAGRLVRMNAGFHSENLFSIRERFTQQLCATFHHECGIHPGVPTQATSKRNVCMLRHPAVLFSLIVLSLTIGVRAQKPRVFVVSDLRRMSAAADKDMQIFAINGERVVSIPVSSPAFMQDLPHLNRGMYIIRMGNRVRKISIVK